MPQSIEQLHSSGVITEIPVNPDGNPYDLRSANRQSRIFPGAENLQTLSMSGKVLLIEDKDSLREMLKRALEEGGFVVEEARDGIEAFHKIKSERFLLILSDLRIPHVDGLEILRVAKEADAETPVIFMTAYGSIEIAVEAMKNGAYDFLPKPVDINHLLLLVKRIQSSQQLRNENMILKEEFSRMLGFPRILGEDRSLAGNYA